MYCSKCGNELKDGSLFCDKCGAKVEMPTPPTQEEKIQEVTTKPVVQQDSPAETVVEKEGVSEERLNYILGLLDNKEETVEEHPKVEENKNEEKTTEQENETIVEPQEEKTEEPVATETIVEETTTVEPIVEEPVAAPIQENIVTQTVATPAQEPITQRVDEQPINPNVSKTIDSTAKEVEPDKKSNFGLISLILGIASIVLAFVIRLWVIPLAIAGIVFGAIEKSKDNKKVVGIALSITSIILAVIVAIVVSIFGLAGKVIDGIIENVENETNINTEITSTKTFEGNGITLTYGSEWKEVEGVKEDTTMLQYLDQESYLIPLGKSALSEYESGYLVDFDTDEGKEKLYETFHSIWSHEDDEDYSNYYFAEKEEFNLLTGDIYIASFEYGADEDNIRGNFFVIVSRSSNSIVSFQTNAATKNVNKLYRESKKLLKTIEITKLDNYVEDEKMSEFLYTMSNWNQYKDIREAHKNGKKKTLEGQWYILSNSEVCWEFKDGEFWFYKSYNDKEDNYWYGTYEYKTGKEGLKLIGVDEDRLENILYQAGGKTTADNVYGVVLHPQKIFADGVDKSETNMSGEDWHYVWIIIDHGDEGLEGQNGDIDLGVQQYYVKAFDF